MEFSHTIDIPEDDTPRIVLEFDENDGTMWFEMGYSPYGEGIMPMDVDMMDALIEGLQKARAFFIGN